MKNALLRYFDLVVQNNFKNDFELTIFVTNYCNQSCEHCFYASELNSKKPEFDLEAFRKIATSLPDYCRKIIFAGGEPFLRNDLFDIVQLFYGQGIREFGFVTNGSMTKKIISFVDQAKKLKEVKIYIQVSLDGPQAVHDAIRRYKGAYQRAMETIQSLRHQGFACGVQTVISKSNSTDLLNFDQEIFKETQLNISYQFVRSAEVSGLLEKDRNHFEPLVKSLLPTNDEIKEQLKLVGNVYLNRIRKQKSFLNHVFQYTSLECKYIAGVKRTNIFPCLAGKKRGVLYPTGEAAICEYFKPAQTKMQDVNYSLKEMWRTPELEYQQKVAKKCHCTHGCFINTTGTHVFFFLFLKNIFHFLMQLLEKERSSSSLPLSPHTISQSKQSSMIPTSLYEVPNAS